MRSQTLLIAILVLLGLGVLGFLASRPEQPAVNNTPEVGQTSPTPSDGIGGSPDGAITNREVKSFTVEGKSFEFNPSEIKVKKGDRVKVTFENTEDFHDWVIDEFNVRTKRIQAGQSETVEFTADKAGTFNYYCSVDNHRQMGMEGTLIIEE